MHLTNYSVNKNNLSFVQPSKSWNKKQGSKKQSGGGEGSKWSLKQLWAYMREHPSCAQVDVDKLIDQIKDLCVKTLIAAEPEMVLHYTLLTAHCSLHTVHYTHHSRHSLYSPFTIRSVRFTTVDYSGVSIESRQDPQGLRVRVVRV